MNLARGFQFATYTILPDEKTIRFNYQVRFDDQKLNFTEKLILPKRLSSASLNDSVKKVLWAVHLMLGVSYWKLYCPKEIIVPYPLTKEEAEFWRLVYPNGLGEFFFKNKIDFRGLVNFPYIEGLKPAKIKGDKISTKRKGGLIGIGGGKDSIVAVERLKKQKKAVTGFVLESSVRDYTVQKKVIKLMGIDCLMVRREIDWKLLDPGGIPPAYYGHVPISAIYSFVGLLLAVVYGYSEVVTANERSANFGNVNYLGQVINHQWSKSKEFERMFNTYIKSFLFLKQISYRSILRNYYELDITKKFIKYEKYFSVFSSCNKNFSITKTADSRWCGGCPKCAFVFLCLAAYLPKDKVLKIFNKNLLADRRLLPIYQDLLGQGRIKPFECVGTPQETNEAINIIINKGEFTNDYIIDKLTNYEDTGIKKI